MSSSQTQSRSTPGTASLADSTGLFTSDTGDATPGSMNDEFVIRAVITRAIKQCPKGREVIAEEMTNLLGTPVTKRALDSYTSESAQQNRWPAQFTRAFCHVTGDWTLLRCVSERAGLHVISKAERKLMELGRQHLIQKRAIEMIAKLEAELSGVDL